MRRNFIWILLGVALLATLSLFLPSLPYLIRAIAAYLLTAVIPGILLVGLLLGRQAIPAWEKFLYGVGVGYGTMVIGTLLLSYLPGGLTQWQMVIGYGLLILLLIGGYSVLAIPKSSAPTLRSEEYGDSRPYSKWVIAGLLSILLVGGFLRLSGLDYAEYQGDEARAALRAGAIMQGYEDVLFLHRKGPTEIVVPTAIFALTGTLTEQAARLPFALSNLAALFAMYALGWRLFGPVAGWSAAMLLALDGYFIGFAHIVQYQSVIFLTTLLAVLLLHRLVRFGGSPTLLLTITAIILATALHSHYEGIWAFIPTGYLLGVWLWGQWKGERRKEKGETATHPLPTSGEGEPKTPFVSGSLLPLGRGNDSPPSHPLSRGGPSRFSFLLSLIPPVITGAVLLALFYVPFLIHPNFTATYTYLADRRIGSSFPYNNLWDFFIRTTLYSTTYYVLLMIMVAGVALYMGYKRGLRQNTMYFALIPLLFLAVAVFAPMPPIVVATIFVLVMVGVWLLPGLSHTERMLWLWFGIPMLVAFFFTEKPRTHVYVFFMPWALLVGMVIEMAFRALLKRVGQRNAMTIGTTVATLSVVVFANYAYWYFAHNSTEILRTWQANRPAGYLTFYTTPDENALFGFPISNGWKVVGSLYEQGVISGEYESNEAEAWVPSWYTRGARRCARSADWYFQIDNLEPFSYSDQLAMEHYLRQGFQEWATVEINTQERMIIWHRTDKPVEPRLIPLSEWQSYFDNRATADLPLDYPTVAPPEIANPLHVNLNNEIWLEGYDLQYDEPLMPGDTFKLTLYWRAQQPIMATYKVFNQVYFGDSGIQAQLDGYPVCEGRDTWRWDPGELITDTYEIQVKEDATPGLYPLYSGMYIEETGVRIPVLDEAGTQTDTQVHVTDIRIGEE